MRTILILSTLALVGALAPLATPVNAETTNAVAVFSNGYRDAQTGQPVTRVAAGETVTWTWESGAHSVTAGVHAAAAPAAFDSGVLIPSSPEPTTFSVTFDEAGAFAYYCKLHPTMRGVVVVE